MDTTGCSSGWATDVAFQRIDLGSCNSSLIAYWIVTMTICLAKFICSVKRTATWFERKHSGQNRGRWPIPPAVSIFASVAYFVLFTLTGLNIVNVFNGVTFSLFSLCFISISFDYLMMLLKLVRLGQKIIPMSLRQAEGDHQHLPSLEKFNMVGLGLLFLQFFSMISSSLVLIVLSPIFPEQDTLFGSIGFSLKLSHDRKVYTSGELTM